MGLLELFEARKPGKVGKIEENKQPIKRTSIPVIILKLITSISIVVFLFYIMVWNNLNVFNTFIFTLFIVCYCLFSYKFIPQADTSNIGLFGGLMDHPFRYTDDLNRFLILLSVLMYPGRFITTTLLQTFMIFKRRK